MTIPLGEFTVTSPALIVSDPYYDYPLDKEFLLYLNNVKPGDWKVYTSRYTIQNKRDINISLTAIHVEKALSNTSSLKWETLPQKVSSEAERIGFFDAVRFKGGSDTSWYEKCCNITDDAYDGASVMPGGAISSSGFGKGLYNVEVCKDNNDNIVCVRVIFYTPNETEIAEPLSKAQKLVVAKDLLKRNPWPAALRFKEIHEYEFAEKAITKTIQKADTDDPLLINYYTFRATIYDKLGKTDLAIEDRRSVQKLRE